MTVHLKVVQIFRSDGQEVLVRKCFCFNLALWANWWHCKIRLYQRCVYLNFYQLRCCCHVPHPKQTKNSERPRCHLPALWLRKLSVTLRQHSQSFTITEVYQSRPCLHPTASSSSSHRTGCTVSKLRFSFTIWFESVLNHWEVMKLLPSFHMVCFPHRFIHKCLPHD